MRHAIYAIPLLVALTMNVGAALAQSGLPLPANTSPEWISILASQGIAVVLVIWWIVKGYPAWLKQWGDDLAKQREEFHGWRKEIADDVRGMRSNLDARPCLLANESLLTRLLERLDTKDTKAQ